MPQERLPRGFYLGLLGAKLFPLGKDLLALVPQLPVPHPEFLLELPLFVGLYLGSAGVVTVLVALRLTGPVEAAGRHRPAPPAAEGHARRGPAALER